MLRGDCKSSSGFSDAIKEHVGALNGISSQLNEKIEAKDQQQSQERAEEDGVNGMRTISS